jgi:hypothetical protein
MMRLLALDIDHTLTGSTHRITESNARAVARALERGVKVTLITGRRYAYGAAGYADTLGLTGLLGCHYGRRIIDHPSGTVIASHPMPDGAARALVDAARPFADAVISVFVEDMLLFEKFPPDFEAASLPQFAQGDLDAAIAADPAKIMSVHVSGTKGPDVVKAVAENCGRLFPGLLDFYYSPWAGDPGGLLTAISSAADKGSALLEIARRLGVDPADSVAMGDSVADIPMLQAAGVGVAMPWADEEARQTADLVADGEPEDAVARAIDTLLG